MIFVGHRELSVVAHVRRSAVGAFQAPISKIHASSRFTSHHPSIDIHNPFFLPCRFNWTTFPFVPLVLSNLAPCVSPRSLKPSTPPSPSAIFLRPLAFFRSRLCSHLASRLHRRDKFIVKETLSLSLSLSLSLLDCYRTRGWFQVARFYNQRGWIIEDSLSRCEEWF